MTEMLFSGKLAPRTSIIPNIEVVNDSKRVNFPLFEKTNILVHPELRFKKTWNWPANVWRDNGRENWKHRGNRMINPIVLETLASGLKAPDTGKTVEAYEHDASDAAGSPPNGTQIGDCTELAGTGVLFDRLDRRFVQGDHCCGRKLHCGFNRSHVAFGCRCE